MSNDMWNLYPSDAVKVEAAEEIKADQPVAINEDGKAVNAKPAKAKPAIPAEVIDDPVIVDSPEAMAARYEILKRELVHLEEELKKIAERDGSFSFGLVKVTKNKGRKSYNYEAVGIKADLEIIEKNTKESTDWKKVCTEAGIEAPVLKTGDPTVTIKIKG